MAFFKLLAIHGCSVTLKTILSTNHSNRFRHLINNLSSSLRLNALFSLFIFKHFISTSQFEVQNAELSVISI